MDDEIEDGIGLWCHRLIGNSLRCQAICPRCIQYISTSINVTRLTVSNVNVNIGADKHHSIINQRVCLRILANIKSKLN